jgi:hypothetical protein
MDIAKVYSVIIIFYMLTIILNFYNMTYRRLLSSAWYPFSTNPLPVRFLILLHQCFTVLNTTVHLIVDVMCFIIMYNAINKLEIAKEECKEIGRHEKLTNFIRSHQEALW